MQKRFKVTVSLKLVKVKRKARELHRVRKIFIKKKEHQIMMSLTTTYR